MAQVMQDGPRPGESHPVPDPTILTTEALQREVRSLEDMDERLRREHKEGIRQMRDMHDKDTDAIRQQIRGGRRAERRLLTAKMDLINEKFSSQERVMNLIEEQRKERKEDDRRALDAALAAAEKARVADTEASDRANTKTELSTAEQLKQQNSTTNQANANVVTLLNALQTRVEKIENAKQGNVDQRQSSSQAWMVVGVIGSLIFGFLGVATAIVTILIVNKV